MRIIARAPDSLPGGKPALVNAIDQLFNAWRNVVRKSEAQAYSRSGAPRHLLYQPLDPAIPNLSTDHQRFVAGRSMRDVETNTVLKVRDPFWRQIAQADDVG